MIFGIQEQAESGNLLEKEFPGYEKMILIGEGAHGLVYRAQDSILNRDVAIKVWKSSIKEEKSLQRFHLEAKSLAAIRHPNIVEVYKQGLTSSGAPYFVMEYVHGITLANYCHEKRLDRDEFVSIFSSVLSALSCAHDLNIVHRDIKPENIILVDTDERAAAQQVSEGVAAGPHSPLKPGTFWKVKLLDFGIARFLNSESDIGLTIAGTVIGSPRYMSPEQCKGLPVDRRSDIYSLGCVMHEAALGFSVFDAASAAELMYQHCNNSASAAVEGNKNIRSAQLKSLLMRALEPDPEKRFQTASDFLQALSKLEEAAFFTRPLKTTKRNSYLLGSLVLGLLVACTAGIYLNWLHSRKETNRVPIKTKAAELELDRARTLIEGGNFTEALPILISASEESEKQRNWKANTDALVLLAQSYHELGQHEKSVEVYEILFQRRLKFGPMNELRATSKLWLAKELACIKSHDKTRAVELLQEAVSDKLERRVKISEERVAEARFLLAEIFVEQGKKAEAAEALSKIWKHFIGREDGVTIACVENLLSVLRKEREYGFVSQAKSQLKQVPLFLTREQGLSHADLRMTELNFRSICEELSLRELSKEVASVCSLKLKARETDLSRTNKAKESEIDEFLRRQSVVR